MGVRERGADQRIRRLDRLGDVEVLRDVAGRMRVHELQPAHPAQLHRANDDAPQAAIAVASAARQRTRQHETLERAVCQRSTQQRDEARTRIDRVRFVARM